MKVRVNTDLCAPCGACVPNCPKGLIRIVNGKARVDEEKCDGCMKCVGKCYPQALTPYDETKP